MVRKKVVKKVSESNVRVIKEPKKILSKKVKVDVKNFPSLNLKTENDIAMDFATKVYKKFNKIVKSIVLFGSSVKQEQVVGSDIDIIIIIDDVTIKWDQELIAWYRQELDEILQTNPYKKSLHINTIKISTWWQDLLRGDPTIINILRYGQTMIDFAGFFDPLKFLLIQGKIKATPEAIYSALQRAPIHIARSKAAELNAVEGLYWSMVDSAHAALIAIDVSPSSPEHIPGELKRNFVDLKKLNAKHVVAYRDVLLLHKKISHGEIKELKGIELDKWRDKAEDFLSAMVDLVDKIISGRK